MCLFKLILTISRISMQSDYRTFSDINLASCNVEISSLYIYINCKNPLDTTELCIGKENVSQSVFPPLF